MNAGRDWSPATRLCVNAGADMQHAVSEVGVGRAAYAQERRH